MQHINNLSTPTHTHDDDSPLGVHTCLTNLSIARRQVHPLRKANAHDRANTVHLLLFFVMHGSAPLHYFTA